MNEDAMRAPGGSDADAQGRDADGAGTSAKGTRAVAASEVQMRARAVRLLAFDVDGTLTDGRIFIGPQGEAMKAFSVRDGFGLTLLREAGLQLAIVTGRRSAIVEHRAAELRIETVLQGVGDKVEALTGLCRESGLALEQAGFVGDDWPDIGAMQAAGFAATVADAPAEVRAHAHWVSTLPPGRGAVRELAEFMLRARGEFDEALARRLQDTGSRRA